MTQVPNFHQIREFCNLYSLQHDFECNLVLISTNKFFKDKKIVGAHRATVKFEEKLCYNSC